MVLNKNLQHKATHLAELLHGSLLDVRIKEFILHHIAELPEDRVTGLISILENEKTQIDNIEANIKASVTRSEVRWQDLADKQRRLAEKFIEKIITEIKK